MCRICMERICNWYVLAGCLFLIYLTSLQDDSTVPFLEGHLHPDHLSAFIRCAQGNWSHYSRVSFHQGVQPGVDLEAKFYVFSISQS
jgi:hypothetical protein